MSTLTNYKGLQVLTPDPSGNGGLAINNDFKAIVDWNPKSKWDATVDPTENDDAPTDNYQTGSLWFNEPTGALFRCVDPSDGEAVWRGMPIGAIGLTAWTMTSDGNTIAQLFLDGDDEQIIPPVNTTWAFTITTVARDENEVSAAWESKGLIKRGSSSTVTLVDETTTVIAKDSSASGWDVLVDDNSNTELRIRGEQTGTDDTNWSAYILIKAISD